uniref:hypothetical protein n=1 Tax=Escherichia coli TaxID=562 RepID=UPI000CDA0045
MKGHNFLPLAISLVFLSGCQQLNEGVNSVNGAINSSLASLNSTVDKALRVSASGQDSGPATSITGLGADCKNYEENAMAAEKKWTGKRIAITNATVLEVTKGRSASDMMTGMPKSAPNYYLLFKTADTSYCGGVGWLENYSGIFGSGLHFNEDQK